MYSLFSDRVDFPFINEKDPSGTDVAAQKVPRNAFGARNWGAGWVAWRVLADFARTDWQQATDPGHWTALTPAPLPVDTEIDNLKKMARDERPDALGEIYSQHEEFMTHFFAVMGGKPSTHTATLRVLKIANLAATMGAMYFKHHYDRPRPAQICPGLLPPIEVPGHASYPSGHATQATIFALCCREVLPQSQKSGMAVALDALAARIARNREIAGLHYASDSLAGKRLAQATFDILTNDTKMAPAPGQQSMFRHAIDRARTEWTEV